MQVHICISLRTRSCWLLNNEYVFLSISIEYLSACIQRSGSDVCVYLWCVYVCVPVMCVYLWCVCRRSACCWWESCLVWSRWRRLGSDRFLQTDPALLKKDQNSGLASTALPSNAHNHHQHHHDILTKHKVYISMVG